MDVSDPITYATITYKEDLDYASCTHKLVMGIDLGSTNLGVVILEKDTFRCRWSGVINLGGQSTQYNDSSIARAVKAAFDSVFNSYFVPDYVVVEQNTHRRWQAVLGGIMLGYWAAKGSIVVHYHPATIKASYVELGRNGHAQNKEDALNLVHSWGYTDLRTDHEADACLLACTLINKLEWQEEVITPVIAETKKRITKKQPKSSKAEKKIKKEVKKKKKKPKVS